ncbi:hypothetical protein N5P37_009674 [Trichoderma harzianum]|uniref:Uncharacterized protein n=1 Tax=Trichoderma harzianum CBS 226.95 TaxID=983964 RepID=A0A2T4AEB1_TRIHA|nr:hypothetical protein M431DRAFT_480924 [Trichoderma harzianum CBS 226.95]KAK0757660.1 hypothetical protein N5P37_009674 [Trichoderma harzianum]PKK52158.1 hypothetical protein CI102_4389 [Trichoderma harzianum]PTB55386.1 hypothetical protein M431DRAFT_480924 [Trichoderma harzianum CBS 226.95]
MSSTTCLSDGATGASSTLSSIFSDPEGESNTQAARGQLALLLQFYKTTIIIEHKIFQSPTSDQGRHVASDKKEESKEKGNEECKKEYSRECKDETSNQCKEECEEKKSSSNKDQGKGKARSQPVRDKEHAARRAAQLRRQWAFCKGDQFPWIFWQLVCAESNWKGWWVLQVKDMKALNWEVDVIPAELEEGEWFGVKDLCEVQIRVLTYDTTEDAQNGPGRTRW